MRDAKQRLQPLDRIDPPDVWERARRLDPQGDVPAGPEPSWQKRVAAGTVAFAVFAGALALVLGAFDDGPAPAPPLTDPPVVGAVRIVLEVDGEEPTARIEVGDDTVDGVGSSYCWVQSSGNASMCADVAFQEPEVLVPVEPGQPLEITGDATSSVARIAAWPGSVNELGDERVLTGTFPEEPGRYHLTVRGVWPQGDRSFAFAIQVGGAIPTSSAEPGQLDAIEVTSPTPGAEVTSPVVIAGSADVFEATVSVEIRDAVNNVIAETVTTATCGTGCRGDFSVEVPFSVGSAQPGVIHVFEVSAMDGRRQHVQRIPVTLLPSDDDGVAAAIEGPWSDAGGNPLPDGTDRDTGYALTMHVYEGPDHCGWTSASFVTLAWPIGSVAENGEDTRQYVRDPHRLFDERLGADRGDPGFPEDAEPTGFRRGGWELWVAPSDVDDAVYGVTGDPRAGGAWERWRRADPQILCA